MARIAGVNVPVGKRVEIGLTYIFGIGRSTAQKILEEAKVDPNTMVKDLTEDEVIRLRDAVDQREVEGDLRRERSQDVKRLMEIGSYRGLRHRRGLPVRGPADQDQRAGPQGPAPDERRRQAQGLRRLMAAAKKPAKGRSRRRVKKNVTYGQAHIKTSFNNTIVTLTDTEGNVIAWESAGSAGLQRLAQVDAVRRAGDG